MDKLEEQTLKLIEEQSKLKAESDAIAEKHRSAGISALTRLQQKSKVEALEKILHQFEANHQEILQKGKIDIPYIANKLGENKIESIKKLIEEIRTAKSFDVQSSTSGTQEVNNANANRKIRLLGIKIGKLNFAIEEIHNELAIGAEWSKELFESKSKFLHKIWEGIAELEEEIEMDSDVEYDVQICQDAFRNLNDVIRKMSGKLQGSKQSSNRMDEDNEGKLPEVKIPVFKGDYRKWENFKDIFETIIHNKKKLALSKKMEYLKTHLDGEPLKLISTHLLSSGNYEDAWTALNKRYNNKRKLLTIHIDNMRKPLGKNVSAQGIKELYDSINEGMHAIKNMGVNISSWDPIIVHLALENLDSENRTIYEEKFNADPTEIPDLKSFLDFLESRFKALEVIESIKFKKNEPPPSQSNVFHVSDKEHPVKSCPKCNENHILVMCPKFLASSPNNRYRTVKNSRTCFRCLRQHSKKNCEIEVEPCKSCKSTRHHSLLHLEKFEKTSTSKAVVVQEETINPEVNIDRTLAAISCNEENREVLATAIIRVKDVQGNLIPARILIDTGAQKNYITEAMVQKLRLPRQNCRTNVTGIGKVQAFHVKHSVSISIESHFDSNFEKKVNALVMGRKLTSAIPDRKIEETLPINWQQLQLADPTFMTPGEIDLVVGIGFFVNILLPGMKKHANSNLMALHSKIGWMIFGESNGERKNEVYRTVQSMVSLSDVEEDLSRFWELEEISNQKFLSSDDNYCEEHYELTHRRAADGKYIVNIPFKEDLKNMSNLGSSRKKALCRFYNLESKLRSNPDLAKDYKSFIHEYISLGHMKKVYDNQEDDDVYFMPHHAVIKPESSTTKLRVVFDGSAKCADNVSINDLMIAGPRLQDDISSILLRWRLHKFVIAADVEKMYRQIRISPEHCKYQRIFWRDHPNEKIAVYELATVTYGTTSAPYLAIKTLQQLAKDEREQFPEAAKAILEDFYVDDFFSGRDSISECKLLQNNVRELLRRGGMTLRKWSSNSSDVLEELKSEDISKHMIHFEDPEKNSMKALGLHWNPTKDSFMFFNTNRPIKKVIIEGNIGSGKSTLLQSLRCHPGIEVLLEPIEKWRDCQGVNLLQNFYDNPSEWSYKFQDYVITTLIESHLKSSTADIKVMERSIFSSKNVFIKSLLHSGYISADEFNTLTKRCDQLIKSLNIGTDLVVYLRSDPNIVYQRMKSRSRPEEDNLPLSVLQQLHNYHEEYVENLKTPVVIIDGNKSSKEVYDEVLHILVNRLITTSVTKRELCSDIARIYDPLGWIAPVTVAGKILFQKTWKQKLDWNDKLPESIQKQWIQFRKSLGELSNIEIPRWIHTFSSSNVELHGFCDASQAAYAAVIYAKVFASDGTTNVGLLIAKSKVAPVKQELTVAKLELCGALLLAKLYQFVLKSLKWSNTKFTAWCDSQITLAWIRGEPSRWQIFVANRISQIQQLTNKADWRYISTKENCADCCSRGITAADLQHHNLWWNGPSWLSHNEENWPVFKCSKIVDMPNSKRNSVVLLTSQESEIENIESFIKRFSSLKKLKIVLAYCLRFIKHSRFGKQSKPDLTTDDIVEAEHCVIRQVQNAYYKDDVQNLKNKEKLDNKSGILALSPQLDGHGLLRVKGRLENCFINYDEKHPIILPRSSYFSKLVVRDAHIRSSHGMETLTEYVVRRRYWIVKGKSLIKTSIFHCIECRKKLHKTETQQMGQLPAFRVSFNNAFFHTGVDYAGPFELKAWSGRCNKKVKSYVVVFVCMVTKAINLELATNLSADTFIAAYRRFSSKRAPCKHMYSDCGSNFVGASRIFKADLAVFQKIWKVEVNSVFGDAVTWHFNPPSAPHMGGLWEAGVKAMKTYLYKHLGSSLLTYEEFITVLAQVEGCLNARPLGALRDVPEDRKIITPSHFLNGESMFSNPEPEGGSISLAQRWKHVQYLKDEISKEYKIQILQNMQRRPKWKHEAENVKVGDIVMVDQDNMFSHKWPLGIIQEVFPGQDGLIRVVSIKMDNGRIIKRPIVKLAVLPILEE